MHLFILTLAIFLTTGCTVNSFGEAFDDSRNESLAKKRIRDAHPELAEANISVTSFDGVLLLTGQVSSAELISIASAQLKPMRNARKVYNELTVAGKTSLLSRTNDSWLTTKVKSAFSTADFSDSTRVKVVTENGVVFLMGFLTRAEAEATSNIARETQGVQKVVKIFEYIN